MKPDPLQALTPREVMKVLRISRPQLAYINEKQAIEYIRTPGGHRRYLLSSVLDYARRR